MSRLWWAAWVLMLAACGGRPTAPAPTPTFAEEGEASFYADRFTGRATASGEAFDPKALTAAHRTLPFGSTIRVTRLDTGASVVVRINDRGPVPAQRVIDLSPAAAQVLGMEEDGVAPVRVELLE